MSGDDIDELLAEESKAVARAEAAQNQRTVEIEDMRTVLSTPAGRKVMWRIIARCHPFASSFAATDRDTCRREGERNVGLWLIAELEQLEAGKFATLLLEAKQAEKTA